MGWKETLKEVLTPVPAGPCKKATHKLQKAAREFQEGRDGQADGAGDNNRVDYEIAPVKQRAKQAWLLGTISLAHEVMVSVREGIDALEARLPDEAKGSMFGFGDARARVQVGYIPKHTATSGDLLE